jgi:hemerythrin-like domain-containing protein
MEKVRIRSRRDALLAAGIGFCGSSWAAQEKEEEEDVTPAEDLMREHGVLKRVLLIYREVIHRIDAHEEFAPATLTGSAELIREFIEDYHEKLEEDHLFPLFRQKGKLVQLVDTLQLQHRRGRVLTAQVLHLATPAALKDPADRARLRKCLDLFVRMYEPHEAREDTVLFPALRQVVSRREYDAMGEDFEKKEHQLFGKDGFEQKVAAVGRLETALGIDDLAKFTPPESV